VTHSQFKDGGTFAAVKAIVPAAKGRRLSPREYRRVCDRPGYRPPPEEDLRDPADVPEEDDIPF